MGATCCKGPQQEPKAKAKPAAKPTAKLAAAKPPGGASDGRAEAGAAQQGDGEGSEPRAREDSVVGEKAASITPPRAQADGGAALPPPASPPAAAEGLDTNPLLQTLGRRRTGDVTANPNVLRDGAHRGIRFLTPTAISGGAGPRVHTVTPCGRLTGGRGPGLKIDGAAPYWHAPAAALAHRRSYRVVNDAGNGMTEPYYPSPRDAYVVVLKAKTVTVSHDRDRADVQLLPSADEAEIRTACARALRLEEDFWCFLAESGATLSAPSFSDLRHRATYVLQKATKRVHLHGDSRCHRYPRAAPMASRAVEVPVSFSADPSDVLGTAAAIFAGGAAAPGGALVACRTGQPFSVFADGMHVEWRLPDKRVTVTHRDSFGADRKRAAVAVAPGSSTYDIYLATCTALSLTGHVDALHGSSLLRVGKKVSFIQFQTAMPVTYETLTDGGEYTVVETGEGTALSSAMVRVLFDVRERDPEGRMIDQYEVVPIDGMAVHLAKVCGVPAAKCRLYMSKLHWSPADEDLEVLYDEGDSADGFYPASIVESPPPAPGDDPSYTVRFEAGDVCHGVLSESIYQNITAWDPARVEAAARALSSAAESIVFVPPRKEVTITDLARGSFRVSLTPGMHIVDVLPRACEGLKIPTKGARLANGDFAVRLRDIKTDTLLTSTTSLWHAVTDKAVLALDFRPKHIRVAIQSEVERTFDIPVSHASRPDDVLHAIKAKGRCASCADWVFFAEADPNREAVVPSWETVVDGQHYVFRQRNKKITVLTDPRIPLIDPTTNQFLHSNAIRQDMIVPPHVKASELWKVIVVHPSLYLSDTWNQLNLPQHKNWDKPSPSPIANATTGTLGIVRGLDIEGPCLLDAQAFSFTEIRDGSFYTIKYPDKLFTVVDREDKETALSASPGDGYSAVCDKIKRAVGMSEGWILKSAEGLVVGAGTAYPDAGEEAIDYISIVPGGVYRLFRDVAVTITGHSGYPPLDVNVPPTDTFDLMAVIRNEWDLSKSAKLSLRNAVANTKVLPAYAHLYDGVTYVVSVS
ncbi:hypothetical protein DIPPA_29603 [Diplonema papillatum]|nr:hypothetical protein DIPPA_29603 [Diplonema papillatum]